MKAKITVAKFVKQDLKEATSWYNKAREGLGLLLLNEVNEKVKQISENPLAYEIKYSNIRVAFTQKFPYGIHFEFLEDQNQIIILAVLHTAVNPQIWKER